ncbi:hypothetical protein [Citrobacter sp. wls613]|uniref:hypothetical protein n=1 Tax=Citrobacter sp. wls613 TaxID=2576436 RepID=UPI0010CA97CA|nr:hypothetical protein [Citrobacter sp. wls613]TKV21910.1 hypothetical protein FDX01_06265 [Citrobacter sp. wls613]
MPILYFDDSYSTRYSCNKYTDWMGNLVYPIIQKVYVSNYQEDDGSVYAVYPDTGVEFCMSRLELDDTRETYLEVRQAPPWFMHWSQEDRMNNKNLPTLTEMLYY